MRDKDRINKGETKSRFSKVLKRFEKNNEWSLRGK
jgi:hypothetical protein